MTKRIDVIIPAHRAHSTLKLTLESLAAQTIANELDVLIVDDACPEGSYDDVVAPFRSGMSVRLIRLPDNAGPGGARQAGIDASDNPYFTCIDADDTFTSPGSLEKLRDAMDKDDSVQRCGGALVVFNSLGEPTPQIPYNVSMDGKLFRRSFVERYRLRFNGTRANEDYGYNLAVDLLCDNDNERTEVLNEAVVNVSFNPDSITRSGSGQFAWDQRLCGFIDNSIWALDLAAGYRPSSDSLHVEILRILLVVYSYWCIIAANAPEYAEQAWEYAKKYYHLTYRRYYHPAYASMEKKLTPETTPRIFRVLEKNGYFTLPKGVKPSIGFKEFLERMRNEEYDPMHIYDVWAEMAKSPEMRARMALNEEIGVCERGYAEK